MFAHRKQWRVVFVTALWALAGAVVLWLTVPYLALAAAEGEMPWDGLEIAIGPVVLVWGAVVAGLVQILKAVKVGEPAKPLLDTSQKIWLANLLLGGVGVLVYEVIGGTAPLQAILNAVMTILSASGLFEAVKTMGKGTSTQSGGGIP